STYVPLKKTGRSYKGLCPFHQEKTPSFIVFPDSGNFHCFGCGKGGDAFTFYMGVERVEFRDALGELARRAGVEIGRGPTPSPEVDAHREGLIELNELAATFYANLLINSDAGAAGRDAFARRGVSAQMIAAFGLGVAPSGWDTLGGYLTRRGIDPARAHEAGLLQERDSGGYYDRFRDRLMFPIRTRDGRVVGFGARAIGDVQPKYLNSAQSAIFDKSALVYGLDLAKDAARSADRVVVVEGYMDAIAAHQFGHANVVACMGTAVTEAQIAQLKRLSRHITLALDADAAGQMATLRSLESLPQALDSEAVPVAVPVAGRGAPQAIIAWERKLNAEISIVRLPEGKDPDELIRRSPETWPEVVATAQPFLDFFVDGVAADVAPADARAKAAAVARMAPLLQAVGDRVVQAHYARLLATRLGLPESTVLAEIRAGTRRTSASASLAASIVPPRAVGRTAHEEHLLALALAHRAICAPVLPEIAPELLLDARNRELLATLLDPRIPTDLDPLAIVAGLDELVADHAERLLATLDGIPARYPGQIERDARSALERLRKERHESRMRELQAQLLAAHQQDEPAEVTLLRQQLAAEAGSHGQFSPPPSPYFRDSRDGSTGRR
ncbi:MAG: DNA primase, partial [Chloroflexia bacterium]|nr:DNA primase [Chloroflexia bacterium]